MEIGPGESSSSLVASLALTPSPPSLLSTPFSCPPFLVATSNRRCALAFVCAMATATCKQVLYTMGMVGHDQSPFPSFWPLCTLPVQWQARVMGLDIRERAGMMAGVHISRHWQWQKQIWCLGHADGTCNAPTLRTLFMTTITGTKPA